MSRYEENPLPFSNVNGTRLFYRLEGNDDCPILVLVHSLGVDHNLWDRQVQDFLPRFRILRCDLRGHGASDAPSGGYTMEALALDVLGIADGLGIGSFCYCGISIGGFIGQWLGANFPERVQKLVLANTSPLAAPPSNWETRRQTVLTQGMEAVAGAFVERSFHPDTVARRDPLVATLRRTLLGTNPAGYAECCAAIRDMDLTAQIPKIAAPTLVIGSDQDVPLPRPGHSEILMRAIPSAHAAKLPTGHLSNIDAPDLFAAAVLDFLA
jgi:3-oxoadipate enol-lactonase